MKTFREFLAEDAPDLLDLMFGTSDLSKYATNMTPPEAPKDHYHAEICGACKGAGRNRGNIGWKTCSECHGFGVVRFKNDKLMMNPTNPPKGVPMPRRASEGNTKGYVTDLLKNPAFVESPGAAGGMTLDAYRRFHASHE